MPEDVTKLIGRRYSSWNAVNLYHSLEHLRYLYWYLPESQETLDRSIYLKDQANEPVYRTFPTFGKLDVIVDDLYFESEEDYGAKKLSMQIMNSNKIVAPQFPAHFLNRKYMDAVSPETRRMDASWKD